MFGMMQERNTPPMTANPEASNTPTTGTREVQTRFGKVSIDLARTITFPKGILGMPDKEGFCLTDFPLERMPQFKLLQCAEDDELAFVTLPIAMDNPYVKRADLEEACATLELDVANVALLLIVSVHRRVGAVNLSVNTRAPIFIDSAKKIGHQYVLQNNAYEIRHMLTGEVVRPASQ